MKRLLLVLTLLWPLGAVADLQTGLEAAQRVDFATALQEWRPLAEAGAAMAQFNLGFMYDSGKGVPKDDTEAVRWYRLAAENGDASAQYHLGVMYSAGGDFVQAYAMFNLAAAKFEGFTRQTRRAGFRVRLVRHSAHLPYTVCRQLQPE